VLPPNHPPVGPPIRSRTRSARGKMARRNRPSRGKFRRWTSVPNPNSMRLATYRIKPQDRPAERPTRPSSAWCVRVARRTRTSNAGSDSSPMRGRETRASDGARFQGHDGRGRGYVSSRRHGTRRSGRGPQGVDAARRGRRDRGRPLFLQADRAERVGDSRAQRFRRVDRQHLVGWGIPALTRKAPAFTPR